MTDPASDPLSTFALDIDTGSYTRFRDASATGAGARPSEVRTEEFVNYFAQDYRAPGDGLGVSIDAAALPFRPDHRLVRVGIRSAAVARRVPAGRRPRPRRRLLRLDERGREDGDDQGGPADAGRALRPTDRVAIVCYSDDAVRRRLEPHRCREREALLDAIDRARARQLDERRGGPRARLRPRGADAVGREGRMTRVVLISDGVANVGETDPGGILERIGTEARAGINLVSVGVGIDDVQRPAARAARRPAATAGTSTSTPRTRPSGCSRPG